MNLMDAVMKNLDSCFAFNEGIPMRVVVKRLQEGSENLKLVPRTRLRSTCYNVLNGARYSGYAELTGRAQHAIWSKVTTLTPARLREGVDAKHAEYNRNRAANTLKKKIGIPDTVIPEIQKAPQDTISHAIEYLFIAEEATKEARNILDRIRNQLT